MLDNPVVIILLTIVVLVLIRFGLVLLLCGGDVGRIGLADRGRLRILRDRQFAEKVKELHERLKAWRASIKACSLPFRS